MKNRTQKSDFKLVNKDESPRSHDDEPSLNENSEDEKKLEEPVNLNEKPSTDLKLQTAGADGTEKQVDQPPAQKSSLGAIVAFLMLALAGGAYWSAGMPSFTILQIALLVIVTVAGIIDWRTKKIFNVITFPAAALGIGLNAMTGGWQAALMAVAGWFLAAIIMVAPDHLIMKKPKMYFGDAKLMAAIGAFLGPGGMLISYFYFSLIYGVVALTRISISFPWKQFSDALKLGLSPEAALDDSKLTKTRKSKIALGPYIALGTFLAIVLQQQTLAMLGFQDTNLFGLPMILSGR